jgi:CBS domain-containing protein
MKLKDVMTREVITIRADSTLTEAAQKMERFNVGCLVVIEDGEAKGILTDRDIVLKAIAGKWDPAIATTREVMQSSIIWADPETDVLEATRLMSAHHVRRLPIHEDGKLVGIVSAMDLAKVIQEEVDNLFSLRATPAYHG